MKKEFDASVAPINEKMDKLEAKLLEVFNTTGMESVRTEFGTAYSSVRSSATVADRESFMTYVRGHDDWGLLEVRPAKLAIEEFRAANDGDLPPGINFTEERVVNVRRTS
jgi:hypothetical protein